MLYKLLISLVRPNKVSYFQIKKKNLERAREKEKWQKTKRMKSKAEKTKLHGV